MGSRPVTVAVETSAAPAGRSWQTRHPLQAEPGVAVEAARWCLLPKRSSVAAGPAPVVVEAARLQRSPSPWRKRSGRPVGYPG